MRRRTILPPGQTVETLLRLPSTIDLWRNLLVLGHEQLAGLTGLAAVVVDAARRPLPGTVKVEGVADDLGSDAGCSGGLIDTRPALGYLNDLRQIPQIWSDVWPVEDRLLEAVAEAQDQWGVAGPDPAEITELHHALAAEALPCMQAGLADMKAAALTLPAPTP